MYVVWGGGYSANSGWGYRANFDASFGGKIETRCLLDNGFDSAFAVLVDGYVYFAADPAICFVAKGLQ
jgi:hypothetical protein